MNKNWNSAFAAMALAAFGFSAVSTAVAAVAERAAAEPPGRPAADDDHTLYALGVLISRNLEDFQLTPAEFERVKAGLIDGVNHRATQVDLKADTPAIQALRQERFAHVMRQKREENQAFINTVAALPGATRTGSGLVMIPIHAGKGASPGPNDEVSVYYKGKLIDGSVFDASAPQGQPVQFGLGGVIPCWSEALQLMRVGGKSRVVCPAALAYGAHGSPPAIGPDATLDFDVELVQIAPGQAAVATNPRVSSAVRP
jgi:FKBP-type peptidyl-prolyl cis-trans isomerase FkpA/FKBP-type peptidyl-prolyl cis-trans isomerase FklB